MLEATGLHKTYPGNVLALEDVSLSAENGLYGLLGPNGAGKSTLMRTLATLQLPDSGTVTLDEIDVLAEPREARRRIGYLPQELGVYPRTTAREMLEYLCGLRELSIGRSIRAYVEEQLERVGLKDVVDRRLDTFSGGMRQRFGIAAAFLGDPQLVIIDEPTAGLDPLQRRDFQLMLAESANECIVLLSTHIVEDLAGLCEHVTLIDGGRVVLSGAPDIIEQTLAGRVWELEIGFDRLSVVRDSLRVLSWRPSGRDLKVRLYSEEQPSLSKDTDGDLRPVEADLEDVYAFHVEAGT
ncbi:MAG: ATP-binding cassette domain-containing protein [Planctomycetota bacterium]